MLLPITRRGVAVPIEAKPLFRPDVLRPYLMAFQLPVHVPGFRPTLARSGVGPERGQRKRRLKPAAIPSFNSSLLSPVISYPSGVLIFMVIRRRTRRAKHDQEIKRPRTKVSASSGVLLHRVGNHPS